MAAKYGYGIVSKLFKSRTILLEQLKEQEYDTSQYENFSINEVNIMVENEQQDMLLRNTTRGNKMYVKYYIDKALRPQNVHDIIDDLYHLEKILTTQDTLMIIVKDKPNDTLVNLVKNLYANEGIYITVLYLAQLQFNILEHAYVPLHKRLTPEQGEMVRKTYNIRQNRDIPEISRFDPVAQVIGLKPGDLCHIIRPSRTAVEENYYRICINK
jgi:DNA-directed RNA polymerase subunit H (RpoH/RPB5)